MAETTPQEIAKGGGDIFKSPSGSRKVLDKGGCPAESVFHLRHLKSISISRSKRMPDGLFTMRVYLASTGCQRKLMRFIKSKRLRLERETRQ